MLGPRRIDRPVEKTTVGVAVIGIVVIPSVARDLRFPRKEDDRFLVAVAPRNDNLKEEVMGG